MAFQEAISRRLKKKICLHCNATNAVGALRCRKCHRKHLRAKALEARGGTAA
ncbi:MAG TPA: 50S ribosomal protein L40e [Candidatus Thermoplasmatota archaeon]|nr:50S ribosomal protein L40e [Candidatus Thermoplasmatota archaeon]